MKTWQFYNESMRTYIQKVLRGHPTLYYLQRCWRYREDEDFVAQVMRANRDPYVMRMHVFGDKNPARNIFLIDVDGANFVGFGGYLRQALLGLYEADRLGFCPVVRYRPDRCLYAEPGGVNGTRNPFEYYFEPVSDISVEEAYESRRVFLFAPAHQIRIEEDLGDLNPGMPCGYNVNDAYLEQMAAIYRKYLRLNASIRRKIEADMRSLGFSDRQERRILGVHIRGTDFALGWHKHPNMVETDDFLAAIDHRLACESFDAIFLATDDRRRLETMRARYGDRLLYYPDTFRGEGLRSVAYEVNDRPHNRYLNGMEVLRDMVTLAACDGLVCGLSQVAIIARIMYAPGDVQSICVA